MFDPNILPECLETLSLQLTELEMLRSMYPGDELITDPGILADVKAFVDREVKSLPRRLDFTLNLHLQGDPSGSVVLWCSLPHSYPQVPPELFARSDRFNRTNQHKFNDELTEFITSLEKGLLYIGPIIQWIQDNAATYFSKDDLTFKENKTQEISFTRLWIFSHHIFSVAKRRTILCDAQSYGVNGFCLPGKPGIICLEGYSSVVNNLWLDIKKLSWKKIELRHEETLTASNGDIKTFCKFQSFQELDLNVRKGPSREYHMDMGQFFQFLDKNNCSYVFKILFGLEGKLQST